MRLHKRSKSAIKRLPIEPATFVVQFSLVEIPDQYFYARFKTRRAALRFVNFKDHDVMGSTRLL